MLRNINRDQTCDSCWKNLPFGFRVLLFFSIGYNIVGMFLSFLTEGAYFNAYKVVHDFQIWRIFFSFLPAGVMPGAIIGILFNFYWLLSVYPEIVSFQYYIVKKTIDSLYYCRVNSSKFINKLGAYTNRYNHFRFVFSRSGII
jgi:hypothetical protein